ncbi:MAG: hypothetical protein ACI3W5_14270 [Faecousia sp.]
MSATAEKWNPEAKQWELVNATLLGESDRNYTYRCASCKAPATLVICSDKDNYFRSDEHIVDCPVAKGHKLLRINTSTEIDLDSILTYEDHDPSLEEVPPSDGGPDDFSPGPNAQEDPDADLRLDPNATHTIRSAGGMFKELIEKHGDSYIDDYTARAVDSIFLRRDTLRKFKDDWGSPTKLVVTKRCSPRNLNYRIPVPDGYVVLRDAYSRDDEDAIYFVVRMVHPKHDRKFKERLFGRTEKSESGEPLKGVGKDPHRNIVIFANWHKENHSHYQVYRADLNSRMVAYVNAPDV